MKRLWVLFVGISAFAAVIPNRYIVELSAEPVGTGVVRTAPKGTGRNLLHSPAADRQRAAIRTQQAAARSAIEAAGGRVVGSIETLRNALVVRIPDAQASALASLPGVTKVYPVHTYRLLLDHALPLHHVPQAWSQVGIGNAGAGIKIAIIDTGIDNRHPGFADAGFTAPTGFPVAGSPSDLAYTNNKVIVARSYAAQFPTPDPDLSAADHIGHGTATAMVAAGVSNAGPLATISGVAPQAWIGSYKVFGTPGYNDYASSDVIVMAIEDAVNDGMDVISMSLGGTATVLSADMEAQILDQAAALGVIVVAAAGNDGPDPATVESPADAPSVIAAGATANDRAFGNSVVLPDNTSVFAVLGSGTYAASSVTGTVADVSNLDGNGLACSSLPAGSLSGSIALIFRGICHFEDKIDNAQAAGAIAVIVYDNIPGEPPFTMGVGAAALPAVLVSNADGLSLKSKIPGGLAVTVQVLPAPIYANPAYLASFSSTGPTFDNTIKPDVLAVGENVYTAAQKLDPNGELYNATGYSVENGTSFSTPLVAGAAAIVKQARPGLGSDQYRSLLINSADPASYVPGTPAGVQQGGAGFLNVLSALNATITASPVSLSFGVGGGTVSSAQSLTLTNVGTNSDTFQISIVPAVSGDATPQAATNSIALSPGASATVPVQFVGSGLPAGSHEGYIYVQGVQSGTSSRVPYWYGVPSNQPAHITILQNPGTGSAGSRISDAIWFRTTDAAGLPVNLSPSVTAMTPGAQVGSISTLGGYIPNGFTFSVRLSPTAGSNVFQIQVGGLSTTVAIVGQ